MKPCHASIEVGQEDSLFQLAAFDVSMTCVILMTECLAHHAHLRIGPDFPRTS